MKKAIFCSAIAFSFLAGSPAHAQWGELEAWSLFGVGMVDDTIPYPFIVAAAKAELTLHRGEHSDSWDEYEGMLQQGWEDILNNNWTDCSVAAESEIEDCSWMRLNCGGTYYRGENVSDPSDPSDPYDYFYEVESREYEEEDYWVPSACDEELFPDPAFCPEPGEEGGPSPILKGNIIMKCLYKPFGDTPM